jgi:4-hydroxy-tetrahydrodipicolinate reductase
MSKKSIGIIGITGQIGNILSSIISKSNLYKLGMGFSKKSQQHELQNVFKNNDYIVDFSSHDIIKLILDTALNNPKPLIICTTGWEQSDNNINEQLMKLSKLTIIIVSPNTSLCSFLQKKITSKIASILDEKYDIDIIERHHRNKLDYPSGTAISILNEIKKTKRNNDKEYTSNQITTGPRTNNNICTSSIRSGNIIGEHSVIFTSENDEIIIQHRVFNRNLFAEGVFNIIEWIEKNNIKNGIYNMSDIFNKL